MLGDFKYKVVTQTDDIFARVAVQRYEARSKELVAYEPMPAPKKLLPLDNTDGASAFEPITKLDTAEELHKELLKARQNMAKYLSDLSPAQPSSVI